MAVLDLIATARDDIFAGRVAMILATVSLGVTTESGGTTNHANRLSFAQQVIKAQVNNKAIAAMVIASNSTIQSTIVAAPATLGSTVPDSDLEFALTTLYDALANAYAV